MVEPHSWSVRLGGQGRAACAAWVRASRVDVSAPLSFDPEQPGVTALEYVLLGVAADVMGGFDALARRRRLVIDHTEALIRAELDNPLVYLGVRGEEGSPAIARIRLEVFADTLDDEAAVRAVWDEALGRSPMAATFRAVSQLEATLTLT